MIKDLIKLTILLLLIFIGFPIIFGNIQVSMNTPIQSIIEKCLTWWSTQLFSLLLDLIKEATAHGMVG